MDATALKVDCPHATPLPFNVLVSCALGHFDGTPHPVQCRDYCPLMLAAHPVDLTKSTPAQGDCGCSRAKRGTG